MKSVYVCSIPLGIYAMISELNRVALSFPPGATLESVYERSSATHSTMYFRRGG